MKYALMSHYLFYLLTFISITTTTKAQILKGDDNSVTIGLGWSHQFQFAGYYAAVEKGYFKENGLEVQLVANKNENNIQSIFDKKYDYGVNTAGELLSSNHVSELVVLAAIFQQSPVSLITLRSRGINNLRELENGEITGRTEIKAMLSSAGVNVSSVNINSSSSPFEKLISGKYDAITYFITDQARLLGKDSLKFKIFRPLEYGINFYGECLFTSKEELADHPDQVEKIKLAVIKGWEYAIANPEEIIDLIQKKYNSALTKEELRREANITIHTLILPLIRDIGDMQHSKWQQMNNVLLKFSIIETPVNLDEFLYTSPSKDSKTLITIIWVTSGIIVIAGAFLLILLLYNNQLKKAVKLRTTSLEKANQEMDRFVYSISHDIRSPLSSVQGIINLMKIDPNDNEKYLGHIESSILRLDNYTRDILDYTRNSRAKLAQQLVDLDEIVAKCMEQVRFDSNSNNISFIKKISLDKPFYSDPWRIEVILNNLLGNSIKYSEKSRTDSFVKIEANLDSNKLKLIITDNGIGIKEEHLDKIYDMFYRASEDSQGSGLGLFIVKETVNLLKGKIVIDSVVGEGTTITVELPNIKYANKQPV